MPSKMPSTQPLMSNCFLRYCALSATTDHCLLFRHTFLSDASTLPSHLSVGTHKLVQAQFEIQELGGVVVDHPTKTKTGARRSPYHLLPHNYFFGQRDDSAKTSRDENFATSGVLSACLPASCWICRRRVSHTVCLRPLRIRTR